MEKIKQRSQNGRFPKGVSGNPSGRPLGSRNKSTLLLEQLLEDGGESIVRKALKLANDGNIQAVKLILDRVLPARKERCIHLELKPVENAQDLQAAFDSIMAAISEGRITPADGQALSEILSRQAAVLETAVRDRRILESRQRLALFSMDDSEESPSAAPDSDPEGSRAE